MLAQWRSGAITADTVCDADFLLVTAAKFHGVPSQSPCPVCESSNLRVVLWIFGEHLGRMSGTARDLSEIEHIAQQRDGFIVHTVEVCPDCKWNHLLQAATARWQPGTGTTGRTIDNGSDKLGE
ncbi:hypothetical protein CEPID_12060 [Corynebacterium epidermidicanis]|uniref:DUF5318 domain-containing protein n=2 Tax=Corynebacterium epidermidicanis TaxID=1050174 RepID=A0A0G3GUQ4_9CORY|nr:hypothetical protein CEPID_12060 [Corynebacterium epidermidicanis]